MGFDRNDEQRMLGELLSATLPAEGARWSDAVVANGLGLLGVPAAMDGLGVDVRDAAVVACAFGRANAGLPWAEHWVATLLDPARAAENSDEPRAGDAGAALALGKGERERRYAADALVLLHCAEMVGLCETMLADAARFSLERRQFGVAIGQFQALRHRMADMAMLLEQAKAITDAAVDAMAGEDEIARGRAVSAARVVCDDAARIVGEGAVQIHGAMGLTAELRLGGFFRRARLLAQGDGGARHHLRRYVA